MFDEFLAMSLAEQIISGSVIVAILMGTLSVLVFLPWMHFNRKADQLPHILDGKPVDIPVLEGEEFQHNKELARKILEKQER